MTEARPPRRRNAPRGPIEAKDRSGLPPTKRSDARERALELLYEAEAKGSSIAEVLDSLPVAPDPLAVILATGVDERRDEALALIGEYARKDWPVERLPMIDRLVLCLAIEELANHHQTPRAVVIDEAVELANRFSTEDSGKFVNGMLTSIAKHLGR